MDQDEMDYVCVSAGCGQELVAVTESLCGECGARTWLNDAGALGALLGDRVDMIGSVAGAAGAARVEHGAVAGVAPQPMITVTPRVPSVAAAAPEVRTTRATAPAPVAIAAPGAASTPVAIDSLARTDTSAGIDPPAPQVVDVTDTLLATAHANRTGVITVAKVWGVGAAVVTFVAFVAGRDTLAFRAGVVAGGAGAIVRRRGR